MSINSDNKKVKYKLNCNSLHMFLLVTILLFMIVITCYQGKNKNILAYYRSKMEKNNKLKNVTIKNCRFYYLDDILKIENFDFYIIF